jgi:hypothetical protein
LNDTFRSSTSSSATQLAFRTGHQLAPGSVARRPTV